MRWFRRALATVALAALLGVGARIAFVAAESPRPEPAARADARKAPPPRTAEKREPRRTARSPSPREQPPTIRWRRSRALGSPSSGRLLAGVQLPAEGRDFFTWDPVRRRSPNRGWRRWGTDRLVRVLLSVLADFRRAHPGAPRIGVGDLSRPRGGDFGPRYGFPGHASHQNGRDADLYYPRRDRRERPPDRPSQIDRQLAQDLVDRLVAAGAARVYVGPNTGLVGPPRIVQVLPAYHDNHLHVRLPPPR